MILNLEDNFEISFDNVYIREIEQNFSSNEMGEYVVNLRQKNFLDFNKINLL